MDRGDDEGNQVVQFYEGCQWHFYITSYMATSCDFNMNLDDCKTMYFTPRLFLLPDVAPAECCAMRMYVSRSGKAGISEVSAIDQEDSVTFLVSILLGFHRNRTRLLEKSVSPGYIPIQSFLDWHRQYPVHGLSYQPLQSSQWNGLGAGLVRPCR